MEIKALILKLLVRPKWIGQLIAWGATAVFGVIAAVLASLSPETLNAIGDTIINVGTRIKEGKAFEPAAVAGIVAVWTPIVVALLNGWLGNRQSAGIAKIQTVFNTAARADVVGHIIQGTPPEERPRAIPVDSLVGPVTIARAAEVAGVALRNPDGTPILKAVPIDPRKP